jgi:hypothetical protein
MLEQKVATGKFIVQVTRYSSIPMTPPQTLPSTSETDTIRLAQGLSEQLKITPEQWHRLKANRKARALEQAAAAMVYLLKDQPEEALARFQQVVGWLDRSITAPPCPSHDEGNGEAPSSLK